MVMCTHTRTRARLPNVSSLGLRIPNVAHLLAAMVTLRHCSAAQDDASVLSKLSLLMDEHVVHERCAAADDRQLERRDGGGGGGD